MKKLFVVLLSLAALFCIASCASAPAAGASASKAAPAVKPLLMTYGSGPWGSNNQATAKNMLPKVTKGQTVTITLDGTSDTDIPYLQVVVVDTSEAANWWGELSEYLAVTTDIKAGTPFSATVEVPITKDTKGETSIAFQAMTAEGVSEAVVTGGWITLTPTVFTATVQ
ncbi:MAG: hypothetical protein LBM77_03895 [Spirochaetaceae bacterium]|jgi:hypothetical protein|nr:hypothetical protein [Spirochaetaceae bacterium]